MFQDGVEIKVTISNDLAELIPTYLSNKEKEQQKIASLAEEDDFAAIKVIAHGIKGSGGGYGFADLTEIGRKIEEAAKNSDKAAIQEWNQQLKIYLGNLKIDYA